MGKALDNHATIPMFTVLPPPDDRGTGKQRSGAFFHPSPLPSGARLKKLTKQNREQHSSLGQNISNKRLEGHTKM